MDKVILKHMTVKMKEGASIVYTLPFPYSSHFNATPVFGWAGTKVAGVWSSSEEKPSRARLQIPD